MQLSLDDAHSNFRIRSYEPGAITIQNHTYHHSLILTPDTLLTDWPPQYFQELSQAHCDTLMALAPQLILLGTGQQQHFLPDALMASFMNNGIGIEVMATQSACRTFNLLLAEHRAVVAALLIS